MRSEASEVADVRLEQFEERAANSYVTWCHAEKLSVAAIYARPTVDASTSIRSGP